MSVTLKRKFTQSGLLLLLLLLLLFIPFVWLYVTVYAYPSSVCVNMGEATGTGGTSKITINNDNIIFRSEI